MRRPSFRLAIILVALLLTLGATLTAQAQTDPEPLLKLEVRGSPYVLGEGKPIEAAVTLREPADLRVRVTDFDGRLVRELFEGSWQAGTLERAWHARDRRQDRVADGPYRVVATATAAAGTAERAEAWVTVADRAIYPQRPEFITVALDPGHGGSYDGAVAADGTREANINLDTGLRLARMLEGAGVEVVITRTTDANVNEPPADRSDDGVIDSTDELAARPDLANPARADLFISIHNNTAVNPSVGGPSTFYFDERAFSGRSARLARIIQRAMVKALRAAVPGDWEPHDHGVLIYPYFVLRGFDPPRLRRPTQMPAVLSEGLFLSNDRELGLLRRPAVRSAMAAAYYDAIGKYLARRVVQPGYELVSGPIEAVEAGAQVTYEVEVRNRGNKPLRDWRLGVWTTPAEDWYVGRIDKGTPAGSVPVPRLAPGKSAVVSFDVEAPAPGGDWTLLFDARDPDGKRASRLGSPMLQVGLSTTDPVEPSFEPASPSAGPSPEASPKNEGLKPSF